MSVSLTLEKIKKAIRECELHLKRLNHAYNKMQLMMPLTEQKYATLDDDAIEVLDHFLFRFAKLQDTLGQRLFSSALELLQEDTKRQSFLDKLNRLEQLGFLESAERWIQLRTMRNQLTHEYEDEPQQLCEAINAIYAHYETLLAIYCQMKKSLAVYMSDASS